MDIGEGIVLPQEAPPEQEEEVKGVSVRLSVFFDGTLNNRTNTQARVNKTTVYRQNKPAEGNGNSYENDQSNVAKMEAYIANAAGFDHTLSLYVEGPGTEDKKSDSSRGFIFGSGNTGVKAKVRLGLIRTVFKLQEELIDNPRIDKLVIDVFGFSRGAAGARYFIYKALDVRQRRSSNLMWRLRRAGYEIENSAVEFHFVGLYDTVASEGLSHSDDTTSLVLDSVGKYPVKKVIHLVAAEEHRVNFSLTNVESAGAKAKDIFLPGVHSDIGGGYRDDTEEELVLNESYDKAELDADRQALVRQGWYNPEEIWIDSPPEIPYTPTPMGYTPLPPEKHKLKARRCGVRHGYDRIPLHIMAEYAREEGVGLKGMLERENDCPASLCEIKTFLLAYAKQSSKLEDWHQVNRQPWHASLRRNYLHFSAHYERAGGIFIPHKPNIVKSRRARMGHYG